VDPQTLAHIVQLLQKHPVPRPSGPPEPLVELACQFETERVVPTRLAERTIYDNRRVLRRVRAELGHLTPGELTPRHILDWLEATAQGNRPREYSILAKLLRWIAAKRPGCFAFELGPTRDHERETLLPSKPKSRRYLGYLADHELAETWQAFTTADTRRWCRWWMADILRCGTLVPLRRGELAALKWRYIDWVAGCIQLEDGKTGDRVVPIGREALAILDRQQRRGEYVWPGPRGKGHVRGDSIYRAWAKIRKRAGLRPLRFHGLRHSFASKALRDGESYGRAGKVLGHSSETMTEYYSHIAAAEVRSMVERHEAACLGAAANKPQEKFQPLPEDVIARMLEQLEQLKASFLAVNGGGR
jgi:integrase